MVYSLRNLIFSFAIVIFVVLLIVLRTLSALRSQEKEQVKIIQSREALQTLGPAIINMQQFESAAINYFNTGDSDFLVLYNTLGARLRNDSAAMAGLARKNREKRISYSELGAIIHKVITLAPGVMQSQQLKGEAIAGNWQSIPLADTFKNIATKLENENREILNISYGDSIHLTRETFAFVKIISGMLILILVISFYFIYHDIRTRKRTEEQVQQFNAELEKQVKEKTAVIRESEEKYRRLHESMMDAYVMVNMQGRLLEFNPSFKEMVGYTDDELLQKNYTDITPVKWHELDAGIIEDQVLQKEYSQVYEKEYIHKSGRILPVELRTFLLNDNSGKPEAMWAIVRDISARKEAKEKLRASEKNLRYVLSSTSDNFYVLDKNYRVTLINEAAKKSLNKAWGASVDTGANILDLIPADNNGSIRKSIDKVFTGEKVEYELNHSQEDLSPWVLVTYTPVSDEAGAVVGAYIVTKDISERKNAERELVEAEAKFRNLVEQSLVGVYIILENKLAYVNPRFAEIFGYEQHELADSFSIDMIVHPGQMKKVAENIRIRLSGKTDSMHYEVQGVKKNKEIIDVEVFGSRTQYKGKPAIIGTLLDISDRKKTEKEKEQVRYLLNERVKELTTLYQVSQVFQTEKRSVKELLQEIGSILPTGWQYPEITAARIVLGDIEFKTPHFGSFFHKQIATFPTPGGKQGLIEIIYLEQRPAESEDAFSSEERNLINMVADMLRIYFARLHEAEINEKMEREMLNQKVQEQKTVTRAVLNAEETERNKIGRELHDNVNQILASIKLFLKMASEKDNKGVGELLSRSVTLLDSAINEIRSLSQNQVTPLKMVDLTELIQNLVDRLDDSTSIKTSFTCKLTR